MRLREFSPDTLEGSFTDDLIVSKLWLIREVAKIHKDFKTIYILGSWYGNMSLFLFEKHKITFDKIINVDLDKSVLSVGQELADKLGVANKIKSMVKDANTLNYRQIEQPSLVINTSVNDMRNEGWFDRIPKGTLVAIQTRDEGLDEFEFTKVIYQGEKELEDPEASYVRVMKIGIK